MFFYSPKDGVLKRRGRFGCISSQMKDDGCSLYDRAVPLDTAQIGGDGPREILLKHGAGVLSDKELLQVLLGSGTKGRPVETVAGEVLRLLDASDCTAGDADLLKISGLGTAKVALIRAGLEFFRRRLCPESGRIAYPADILPLVSHYADRKQEHFLVLTLNGAHEVINLHVVCIGLVNRTLVHPREVYIRAIADSAASLIAAHNHPSGNLEPSAEDRDITARLKEAGDTVGINLLDHIIFSRKGYFSFLENREI